MTEEHNKARKGKRAALLLAALAALGGGAKYAEGISDASKIAGAVGKLAPNAVTRAATERPSQERPGRASAQERPAAPKAGRSLNFGTMKGPNGPHVGPTKIEARVPRPPGAPEGASPDVVKAILGGAKPGDSINAGDLTGPNGPTRGSVEVRVMGGFEDDAPEPCPATTSRFTPSSLPEEYAPGYRLAPSLVARRRFADRKRSKQAAPETSRRPGRAGGGRRPAQPKGTKAGGIYVNTGALIGPNGPLAGDFVLKLPRPLTAAEKEVQRVRFLDRQIPVWDANMEAALKMSDPLGLVKATAAPYSELASVPGRLLSPKLADYLGRYALRLGEAESAAAQAGKGDHEAYRRRAAIHLELAASEGASSDRFFREFCARLALADLLRFTDRPRAGTNVSEAARLIAKLTPAVMAKEPLAAGKVPNFKIFLAKKAGQVHLVQGLLDIADIDANPPGPARDAARNAAIVHLEKAAEDVEPYLGSDAAATDIYGQIQNDLSLVYGVGRELGKAEKAARLAIKHVRSTAPDAKSKPLYSLAEAMLRAEKIREARDVLVEAFRIYPVATYTAQQAQILKYLVFAEAQVGDQEAAAKLDRVGDYVRAKGGTPTLENDKRFQPVLDELLQSKLGRERLQGIRNDLTQDEMDRILRRLREDGLTH